MMWWALLAFTQIASAQFAPTDTDCMRWARMSCYDGECPLLSPSPLVVGHQICSGMNGTGTGESGGVQGMLICTDPLGQQVGHQNVFAGLGFDSKCAPSGPECWVRDSNSGGTGEKIDSFWVANENKINLTWTLFHSGQAIPSNAYKVGGLLLGRSTGAVPNQWGDKGNIVPGWVTLSSDGAMLGSMSYEDYGSNTVQRFYLATCHPPTHDAYSCNRTTWQCVAVAKGSANSFSTQQSCAQKCKPPPPPPPGPPPPPPVYSKPYLRFGMTVPVDIRVDCTVLQHGVSHTWSNFGFGEFSNWTDTFEAGMAQVTLAVASGGSPLLSLHVTLTSGPLVLMLRADNAEGNGHYWPPTNNSLEPIAASYVPSASHTVAVRLFNLSPDTSFAGMRSNQDAAPLADNVQYSLGSNTWAQLAAGKVSLAIFDSLSSKQLAVVTAVPPLSPSASTLYLIGVQTSSSQFKPRAVLLEDAPLSPVYFQ